MVAKSLPLRDFLAINKLAMQTENDPVKQSEQSELLLKKFSEALISWNLEDEHGKPIPATYAGLLSQEVQFAMEIIRAWMEAIATVPKSSGNKLNGTGTYPELSIPMEVS